MGWWSFSRSLAVLDHARQYTSLAQVGGDSADIILFHNSQHASRVKSLLDKRGDSALGEALITQQGKELMINCFPGVRRQRRLWGNGGRSRKRSR